MRIAITIDGRTFHATLTNSQANQDLIEQLPQTLEMRDHGGVPAGRLHGCHCRANHAERIPQSATSGTTPRARTSSCTTATKPITTESSFSVKWKPQPSNVSHAAQDQ